jgi:hypothetical protein
MTLFSNIFGFAIFAAFMAFAFRIYSVRWRLLTQAYAAPWPAQFVARKRVESIILLGGGLMWSQYLVSIRVTETGLALRLFPFHFLNPCALFPFIELKAERSHWYLNKETWQLTAAQAPGFRIMVDRDRLDWIRKNAATWEPFH